MKVREALEINLLDTRTEHDPSVITLNRDKGINIFNMTWKPLFYRMNNGWKKRSETGVNLTSVWSGNDANNAMVSLTSFDVK